MKAIKDRICIWYFKTMTFYYRCRARFEHYPQFSALYLALYVGFVGGIVLLYKLSQQFSGFGYTLYFGVLLVLLVYGFDVLAKNIIRTQVEFDEKYFSGYMIMREIWMLISLTGSATLEGMERYQMSEQGTKELREMYGRISWRMERRIEAMKRSYQTFAEAELAHMPAEDKSPDEKRQLSLDSAQL